jgi:hypothetical protein
VVKGANRTAKVAQIAKIKLNGEEIDNVDSFEYLKSVITSHGSDGKEVQLSDKTEYSSHMAASTR